MSLPCASSSSGSTCLIGKPRAFFARDVLRAAISLRMSSAPVTNTDLNAAWLCGLLQANDSFYPTGSYAHSFGLEGLVQESVVHDRATLREFLFRSVMPSLRHVELPIAAHAWRAFEEPSWT